MREAEARPINLETVDPVLFSSRYDLGTWTFHATGFVAAPFIHYTESGTLGNGQLALRGRAISDGTVPALPLAGFAAVMFGVLVSAGLSLRSRRRRY